MTRYGPLAGALVLALSGAGCRTDANAQPPTEPSAAATSNAGSDAPTSVRTTSIQLPRAGAAHTSNIDQVALSDDGSVAATRDQTGSVRVWPSLDGSKEPIVVPERGAQMLSVEADGKGQVVALVDAANGGKIFKVSPAGQVLLIGEMPPFEPLFELHALPGGQDFVALYKDHSIKIVDRRGKVQTSFSERRFRPAALRVVDGGKGLVAMVARQGSTPIELQRLTIKTGDAGPKLARQGSPTVAESETTITLAMIVVSPDAQRAAWVHRTSGTQWEIRVADLTRDQPPTTFQVTVPTHVTPTLGFVTPSQLLVSSHDGTLSWLRDLDEGVTFARTAAPQDFANQGRSQTVRGSVQAASHGTWLFVHDVPSRQHRFLGYQAQQTQSVAVSPSGSHVAWLFSSGPVVIEALDADDSSAIQLPSDPTKPPFRALFVDDDRLLLASAAGQLQLVRWRTGVVLATSGINGNIRKMEFEPARNLLLVERANNDARVFELTDDGFSEPFMVADQSFRSGLLAKGMGDDSKAVMWSLDSASKLRLYTARALRSDLSLEDIAKLGTALEVGKVAPLAIDRVGRRYGVRWDGSRMQLFVEDGDKTRTEPAPAGDVNQIVPSFDGARFLAIHQRGNDSSITAHDTKTLEVLWSYSSGVFNNQIVWSRDGRFVAVAASTGAAILDGSTGEIVHRRCGMGFAASRAPSPTAFGGNQVKSVCE